EYTTPTGLPLLEVADTRVALADLARWWRSRLRGKVIGITGSSGKTTTRRLVHAALGRTMKGSASPKSYNNDIGVPLTVLGAAADDGYLVCEIGMSHPGEIAPLARIAAPNVAIITMAGRAHIGNMGSVQAIIHEKASLVDGLNTNGMAVVNGDQPELVAAVNERVKPGVRVATFGTTETCQWKLVSRTAKSMRLREPDGTEWECALALPGDYNAMNALAAIAAARLLGVPATEIAAALPGVGPADMRMTRQSIGGVDVFNDAYNANPDAMLASLRAFVELTGGEAPTARRVTVLGDMLELGDQASIVALHAEVGRAVAAVGPAVAIFVGDGSAHGARAASEAGSPAHILHVPLLDESGVSAIAALLRPGDAILLKGSRGSRMEQLIAALEARANGARTAPCSTT
ncbi:MAG: UDP-N-acetylmuramoyl-tripeptide--D-alanyl-D-alanine ligase, partial [Phycisphaerae bacterium]|nr:UDP-N-acetylmuramoyl-tripeptide--D-alanyl-D-alanine ligase [Phycisphaerae bacterium]